MSNLSQQPYTDADNVTMYSVQNYRVLTSLLQAKNSFYSHPYSVCK